MHVTHVSYLSIVGTRQQLKKKLLLCYCTFNCLCLCIVYALYLFKHLYLHVNNSHICTIVKQVVTIVILAVKVVNLTPIRTFHKELSQVKIKGFVQSTTAVSMWHCHVIFTASFLQRHFCNVILIRRIILIFRFGQNHWHRPHSCPCRQQLVYIIWIYYTIKHLIVNLCIHWKLIRLNGYFMSKLEPSVELSFISLVTFHLGLVVIWWGNFLQIGSLVQTINLLKQ